MKWQMKAACRTAPPNDMTDGGMSWFTARDLAESYCFRCPVMQHCRTWADSDKYFTGLAGGILYKAGASHTRSRFMLKVGDEILWAINWHLPREDRERHRVAAVHGDFHWQAKCGAMCTPTLRQAHERLVMAAPLCLSCERL